MSRRQALRFLVWLTAAGSLGLSDSIPWSGIGGRGPACRGEGCPLKEEEKKRDIFMSRGWGAGGMPFTLYYPGQGPNQDPREQPQVEYLTSRHQQHQQADQGKQATLPQLFVSYGWGPLGRK